MQELHVPTRLIDLPRRKRDQTAVVKQSQISVFKVVSGTCERVKRPKGIEKQYIVSSSRMIVMFRLVFHQVRLVHKHTETNDCTRALRSSDAPIAESI